MPTNLKPSPSGKTAYGDGNPTPALYVIRQTYVTISVTVFLTACRIRNGQTFACATQKRSSAGLLLGKARPKLATEDTYRTAAGKLTRTQVQTTITRLLYLAPIRTPAVPTPLRCIWESTPCLNAMLLPKVGNYRWVKVTANSSTEQNWSWGAATALDWIPHPGRNWRIH